MEETSFNGLKTLLEKVKLLVKRNFSFFHHVFKRLVLQTRENQGLFGKGLNNLGSLGEDVEKGKIADYQHVLFSYNVFKRLRPQNCVVNC